MPKKQDTTQQDTTQQDSSATNEISVLELDYKWLDKVTVTNANGSFVFTCERKTEKSDGEETVTAEWLTEGYDKEIISSTLIGDVLSALDNISASREITTKTADLIALILITSSIYSILL